MTNFKEVIAKNRFLLLSTFLNFCPKAIVKTRTMTIISLQQTPNNKDNYKKSNNNKRRPSKKENDIVAP